MYGVPADLPIAKFVGAEFNQVCLGRFQLQLHASGTGSISVEGRWELRDSRGELLDAACEHEDREAYRVHHIIDVPIAAAEIDAPRSFTIRFQNGCSLTVFDDTPQHEACSLNIDGMGPVHV